MIIIPSFASVAISEIYNIQIFDIATAATDGFIIMRATEIDNQNDRFNDFDKLCL